MCLNVLEGHERMMKAEEDIVCYKIVDMYYFHDFTNVKPRPAFQTPYQYAKVKLNSTLVADGEGFHFQYEPLNKKGFRGFRKIFLKDANLPNPPVHTIVAEINGGGIHTFKNFDDAINTILYGEWDTFSLVVKCTIPKGTQYYYGEFSNVECYCSRSINVTNEVIFVNTSAEVKEFEEEFKKMVESGEIIYNKPDDYNIEDGLAMCDKNYNKLYDIYVREPDLSVS